MTCTIDARPVLPLAMYEKDEPPMTPEEFKQLREDAGLTFQMLADALGTHIVSVQRWESGDMPIMKMTAICMKHLEELVPTCNTATKKTTDLETWTSLLKAQFRMEGMVQPTRGEAEPYFEAGMTPVNAAGDIMKKLKNKRTPEFLDEAKYQKMPPKAIKQVLAMRVKGASVADIANKFGVSRQAIYNILRRFG